jgi:hypothetical protein
MKSDKSLSIKKRTKPKPPVNTSRIKPPEPAAPEIKPLEDRLRDLKAIEFKTPDAANLPKALESPTPGDLFAATSFFLDNARCASGTFDAMTPILAAQAQEKQSQFRELAENVRKHRDVRKAESAIRQANNCVKTRKSLLRAGTMFREHSVVLLVSSLNEFIANALRIAFKASPDRLKGDARSLSYPDLLMANSIQEVFTRFAEKEIDLLLRRPQDQIISYLDENFKVGIKEHFPDYPSFVEVCERRNLFMHSGGIVTAHYLANSTIFNWPNDPAASLGAHLAVSNEYHANAAALVIDIGMRIGQGVARRVFPNELAAADEHLINFGLDLLQSEEWNLAKRVFEYAMGIPEKSTGDEANRRVFLVNLAIAYKWGGNPPKALELLDSVDWSASGPQFSLAEAVLREDFTRAAAIMSNFSANEVSEEDFRRWPVFRDFRASRGFAQAFKKLFGKDFVPQLDDSLGAPSAAAKG